MWGKGYKNIFFSLLYFFSEVCLEQALTAHALLAKGMCPYKHLEAEPGT